MSKENKPLYVIGQSEIGDCNKFILTRTHMKPYRNAKDFVRCIGRKEVLAALNDAHVRHIECTDIPGSDLACEWDITRNPDGSIAVGCTEFSKEAVAKIREWAEAVTA